MKTAEYSLQMETLLNNFTPDSLRPCSNCKKKKVKCVGTAPSCTRCKKYGLSCDLSDNVLYSYSSIETIITQIKELEAILESKRVGSNSNLTTLGLPNNTEVTDESKTPESVHKEPETLDELSDEVGTLTTSGNDDLQGKYIGAATGSNFAKAFLKQMHLQKLDDLSNMSSSDFSGYDHVTSLGSTSCSPLPPYNVGKMSLNFYMDTVHPCYPVFVLKDFLEVFETCYKSPQSLTYHDKYMVFMVIAIGFERGEKDCEIAKHYNQYKPIEFYNTAFRYLEKTITNRSIDSLQELLLLMIWKLNTDVFKDDYGDFWYMGRYLIALAIELELHLTKNLENLSENKIELRKRLFWSSFLLERGNTVKYGRGLTIRMHNIEIGRPSMIKDDTFEFYATIDDRSDFVGTRNSFFKNYNVIHLTPCLLSIELYEIYGVLLETVYISRTKGSTPRLDMNTIIGYKTEIERSISSLLIRIESELPHTCLFYHELKIKSYIGSIILHRPSPSFPNPNDESLKICRDHCLQAVESFKFLTAKGSTWKTKPASLHDLVNIGLTMIFCCWKIEKDSTTLKSFSSITLNVMNDMIDFYPSFIKFKNLYIVISAIIIKSLDEKERLPQTPTDPNNIFNDVPSPLQNLKQNLIFQQQWQPLNPELNERQYLNNQFLQHQQQQEQQQQQTGQQNQYQQTLFASQSQYEQLQRDQHLQQEKEPQQRHKKQRVQHPQELTSFSDHSNVYTEQNTSDTMPNVETRHQPRAFPYLNMKKTSTFTPKNSTLFDSSMDAQSPHGTPAYLTSKLPMKPSYLAQERNNGNGNNNVQVQQQQHLQQQQPFMNVDPYISNTTMPDGMGTVDPMTQELFQDIFNKYYFQGNDSIKEDIDQLFEFQKFNWL